MASYNKVILMGNLTREIELKTIGSGQSVAKMGLAINRNFTTAAGEKREEVTFVDCEAWGKTAEVMAKYLTKGRPVFIEGRLKLDTWDDKETGGKRSKLNVVIESFQFVDSKGGGEGGGGGGGDGAQSGGYAPRSAAPAAGTRSGGGYTPPRQSAPAPESMGEEDIPF